MPAQTAILTDTAREFDAGPLIWVHGEIGQSLARGLELLVAFAAAPVGPGSAEAGAQPRAPGDGRDPDGRARRRRRLCRRDRAPARAARGSERVGRRGDLRAHRSRVSQARDLHRRAGGRCAARSAQAVPGVRGDAARARRQGRRAHRPVLPGPGAAGAGPGGAAADGEEPARVAPRQAATPLRERAACLPARRQEGRADHARRGCRHRARQHGPERARLLVDRRGVLRRDRRGRPRARLRGEAARCAHRPPDPPRRRGIGESRRPAATRGALLRRRERAGDAFGTGRAERLRAGGADPLGRDAERGRRPSPADPAGRARASGRGEGPVDEGQLRSRGQHAEAERRARGRAQERRRDRRRLADETDRVPGRAARRDASFGQRIGVAGDGICDGHAAGRDRGRDFRRSVEGVSGAGRGHAAAARRRPGIATDPRLHGAVARRNVAARAGARAAGPRCARNAGEPPAHGTGARRLFPGSREAPRARDAEQGQPADPRRAEDSRPGRGRAASGALPGADRQLRGSARARGRRGARAARRVALRARVLHRGARAAAARSAAADRAAAGEAPRRNAADRRRRSCRHGRGRGRGDAQHAADAGRRGPSRSG